MKSHRVRERVGASFCHGIRGARYCRGFELNSAFIGGGRGTAGEGEMIWNICLIRATQGVLWMYGISLRFNLFVLWKSPLATRPDLYNDWANGLAQGYWLPVLFPLVWTYHCLGRTFTGSLMKCLSSSEKVFHLWHLIPFQSWNMPMSANQRTLYLFINSHSYTIKSTPNTVRNRVNFRVWTSFSFTPFTTLKHRQRIRSITVGYYTKITTNRYSVGS